MRIILPLLVLLLLAGSYSVQAQPDKKYLGTYQSNDHDLKLSVFKKGEVFEVQFLVQGKVYKGEASPFLGMLSGSYAFNGSEVSFTLSRILGQYILTSEGHDLPIERTSETPVALQAKSTASATSTKAASGTAVPAAGTAVPETTSTTAAASGMRTNDASLGFGFNAPSGFKIQKDENGNYTLSESANAAWVVVVASGIDNDKRVLYTELNKPMDINGNKSKVSMAAQPFGDNGVVAEHIFTAQGQKVYLYIIGLTSPYDMGASVTLVSNNVAPTASMRNAAQSVAHSINFTKPVENAQSVQYRQRVAGKRLLYLYTGNGYSEKWYYDLCSDGSFRFYSDMSYTSGGFSGSGNDGNTGRWRVISKGSQSVLVLSSGSNGVQELSIAPGNAGNELKLNGKRYFLTSNESCR
jgi:hypothetical protein